MVFAAAIVAVAFVVLLSDSGYEPQVGGTDTLESGHISEEMDTPGDIDAPSHTERTASYRTGTHDPQDTFSRMILYNSLSAERRMHPLEYAAVAALSQPINVSHIFMEEGFLFEITDAAIVGNALYLHYTLEDLVGRRFDELTTFIVDIQPKGVETFGRFAIAVNSGIGDFGAFNFRSRSVYAQLFESQEFTFELLAINHSHKFGEYELEIDLSTLAHVEAFDYIADNPILQPHTHLVEFAKPGFELTQPQNLSAIGIINGQLHIQQSSYRGGASPNHLPHSHVSLFLLDPMGNIVPPRLSTGLMDTMHTSVHFMRNGVGDIFPLGLLTTGSRDRIMHHSYPEEHRITHYIYSESVFDVDLDRISEYRLVASFSSQERTTLDWETSFEVNVSEELGLWADVHDVAFNIGAGAMVTISELMLTPSGVVVVGTMHFEGLRMSNSPALMNIEVSVHTADGVFQTFWGDSRDIASAVGENRIINEFSIFYAIDPEIGFLRPGSVTSIEINGHIIPITQ